MPSLPPKGALRLPQPPAPLRPSSANSPKLTRGLCHTGGAGVVAALLEAANPSECSAKQQLPLLPPPPFPPPQGPRRAAVVLTVRSSTTSCPLCRRIPSPTKESTWCYPAEQPIAAIQLLGPACCLTSFRLFDFQMTISCSPAASSRAPPPPHSNRPPSHSGSERSQLFPCSLIAAYFLTDSAFVPAIYLPELYKINNRAHSGFSHLFQLRETSQKKCNDALGAVCTEPRSRNKALPAPHLRTEQQVAPSVLFYAALSLISLWPGCSTVCHCFTSQHFGLYAAVFHPELSKWRR